MKRLLTLLTVAGFLAFGNAGFAAAAPAHAAAAQSTAAAAPKAEQSVTHGSVTVDGMIALPEGDANDHDTSGVLDIWRLPPLLTRKPNIAGKRTMAAESRMSPGAPE